MVLKIFKLINKMERYTLQDCIKYFNQNELMRPNAIRNMETIGEWRTASIYWLKLNDKLQSDACLMIAQSIEEGDKFREETKYLFDWVEETVENNIMSREEAYKFIYPKITEINKQIYSNV